MTQPEFFEKGAMLFFQRRSRPVLIGIALALVGVIGAIDYFSGFERSLLAFYLIPVALSAWFVSRRFAVLVSLLSVVTWIAGDVAAGATFSSPAVPFWNGLTALISFLIVLWLVRSLRSLISELELRVRERTVALRQEIAIRVRLEKEIAEISERERQRLGHELHDSLCQHLTGISLAAQVLGGELAEAALPQAQDAQKVIALIEEAIGLTRDLARGLISFELEGKGLCAALKELARESTTRSGITCVCSCGPEVKIRDSLIATHLFRIAQEAITNAVRHSHSDRVVIKLNSQGSTQVLSIEDNGIGVDASSGKR